MAWRITYWRGMQRLGETVIRGPSTAAEVATMLKRLAERQSNQDALRSGSREEQLLSAAGFEVHTSETGTILWTSGKEFHYTAEWF